MQRGEEAGVSKLGRRPDTCERGQGEGERVRGASASHRKVLQGLPGQDKQASWSVTSAEGASIYPVLKCSSQAWGLQSPHGP